MLLVINLLQVVQPQPQARSSTQEATVAPHSTDVPQSPVAPQSSLLPQSPVAPQSPVTPHSPVAPQSPVVSQSPVANVLSESHMVQTLPAEEEEDVAIAFDAGEETSYSAIALYDYQAGRFG